VRDFQHDLAWHASILFGPERLGAAGEREHGADQWPQLARVVPLAAGLIRRPSEPGASTTFTL